MWFNWDSFCFVAVSSLWLLQNDNKKNSFFGCCVGLDADSLFVVSLFWSDEAMVKGTVLSLKQSTLFTFLLVCIAIRWLCKSPFTFSTLVWPFSCMNSHMSSETGPCFKSFWTLIASKWFLSCMHSHMSFMITLIIKSFLTNVANMIDPPFVN